MFPQRATVGLGVNQTHTNLLSTLNSSQLVCVCVCARVCVCVCVCIPFLFLPTGQCGVGCVGGAGGRLGGGDGEGRGGTGGSVAGGATAEEEGGKREEKEAAGGSAVQSASASWLAEPRHPALRLIALHSHSPSLQLGALTRINYIHCPPV